MLQALLSLNKRGQHNWVKILCLGIGLAAGVVLIGKVGFEQSYDDFFPTSDHLYIVYEDIIRDGEYKEYPQTAGAIAPALQRYCPQVEAATRYTGFAEDMPLVTDDDHRLRANFALADSCFFDVFPFRVLAGNPKKVLSQTDYCMVPRSLAEKIGPLSDVVGQKIYHKSRSGLSLTIGGVYEDIPLNSTLTRVEVLVSMPTIGKVMWDGRENWLGNDRYHSYVRLAKGVGPDDLKPQIEKMRRENMPLEEMQKAGIELGFSLKPLLDYHAKSDDTRRMTWILSLLAAVLIGCAVMNYLLLVVGGISRRGREMAVHKCYGAEPRNVYGMVMAESIVHLLLSLVLAGGLLFLCRHTAEHITGAPLTALLTAGSNVWMLLLTGLVVLLVTGVMPSWLYTHVPVAAAFHGYQQTHRAWKLLLLGLQFASATFLIVLLAVVGRQYRLMVTDNPGYDYSTLAVVNTHELDAQQRQLLMDELRKLSTVKGLTASFTMLTDFQSGDNITLPDDDHEYMNVADLFFTADGYFDVMGIPVVSGRTFTEQTDTLCEVMVSRSFEQRMQQLAGWDRAVGKQFICSSFGNVPYTVVGVYEDPRLGSITSADVRPSICYYTRRTDWLFYILLRLHSMEGLEAVNQKVHQLLPDNPDIQAVAYNQIMTELYTDTRYFRTTVLIGGLVALAIALIGLVGYLHAEVSRRQKEIAIRKVNGARTRDVLRLFLGDVLWVALPSVVAGAVGAWAVARLWLQQFSEKAPLTPLLFALCALLVLSVILSVVILQCYRVASSNPVGYLKNE